MGELQKMDYSNKISAILKSLWGRLLFLGCKEEFFAHPPTARKKEIDYFSLSIERPPLPRGSDMGVIPA